MKLELLILFTTIAGVFAEKEKKENSGGPFFLIMFAMFIFLHVNKKEQVT